jgi:hypothetical protein
MFNIKYILIRRENTTFINISGKEIVVYKIGRFQFWLEEEGF